MSILKKIVISGLILGACVAGVFTLPKTLDLYKNVGGGSGTITKLPGSGLALGTAFDVPFMNSTGTAYTTKDRYFEYDANREYLKLFSGTNPNPGVLNMDIGDGNTVFTSELNTLATQYMLSETPFSSGVGADIGSWGSDANYFWIKYGADDDQWGIPLILNETTATFQNPHSYDGGSRTIALDTLDGDFIAGDVAGAYTGIALYLYGGAEQFIIGSFLSGNYYNYDNALATNNFVYGGLAKQIFSETTVTFDSDLKLNTAGNGIYIKEGTNAMMGTCTLVAGTCTVSTNKVTANSRIFPAGQNSSGVHGELTISARTAGTSFTITSTSATDTRLVAWEIKEPA